MAGRGGKRPGAGRKPGAVSPVNKALAEIAKAFAPEAINVLVDIMRNGEKDVDRRGAADSILDRGYGRPFQALHHSGPDGGPVQTVTRKIVDPSDGH